MSRASLLRSWALGLTVPGLACGCQADRDSRKQEHAATSPSALQMDGMQLSAARRVGLESAAAAMQQRDLKRLKQLSVWVRHRAQVALLEPDDLQALDLSIQCLEQAAPPPDAQARLEQLKSGALREPARGVCLSRAGN